MKISITAHPKSKKIKVLKKDAMHYEVWVREAPDKNRANEAIIEALSEVLDVPKSRIQILRGHQSKNKIMEIS